MVVPITNIDATGLRSWFVDLTPWLRAQGYVVSTGKITVERIGPFVAWRFDNLTLDRNLALPVLSSGWIPPTTTYYGLAQPYYRNAAQQGLVLFRGSGTVETTVVPNIAEMSIMLPARSRAWPTAPPL